MILIIGGGISGLLKAYQLQKNNQKYLLIESSNRVGGVIKTEKLDQYLLEYGPNSLLCDQSMIDILQELELKAEIIDANPVSKFRFILDKGKPRAISQHPIKFLFDSLVSFKSKIKLIKEIFLKSKSASNETVSDFFTRRLGLEITQKLVQPFVSGIYAGDPQKLLMKLNFPSILKFESDYGSIIKGLIKTGIARKRSISFKNGMQQLPQSLSKKLNCIEINTQVESISNKGTQYLVKKITNNIVEELIVDQIIISTPSYISSKLIENIDPILSELISKIRYSPMVVVHTVFKKSDIEHSVNGFGCLHPSIENSFTLGNIWSSVVFDHRAPKDEVLFTTFIGGDITPEKANLDEKTIFKIVENELIDHYNIKSKSIYQHYYKWEKAIPQYDKKVLKVQEYIDQNPIENITFAANWYNGVSLSDRFLKSK